MSPAKPTSDPYRTLGVPRGADQAQIKAAHRSLAKLHHPDAGATDEGRFLAVQEAYRLLSDPLRRRDWDRQHGSGPVDARDRAPRSRSRSSAAHWTREDTTTYRRGRQARRGSTASERAGGSAGAADRRSDPGADRSRGPAAGSSGRDPGAPRYTWSAESVPWWEDFSPRQRPSGERGRAASAGAAGGPAGASSPEEDRRTPSQGPGMDFEVFNRSSGAAWSSAARRHFRRDEADLPSRGAFRYRGSQVVTGAEARKVAAEEAAAGRRGRTEADLFRGSASTPPAPRQAFDHAVTPTHRAPTRASAPATASVAAPVAPAAAQAPDASPGSATREPGTSRPVGLGVLGGAVAAGVPAAAAGFGLTADGGSSAVLAAFVLLATLGGAAIGYLLVRGSAAG